MSKLTMPVRRDRSTYREQLAEFRAGPGPFLSLYLDVRPGEARRGAKIRLLATLDELTRNGQPGLTPEQWSAAGDTIPLIEDDDRTLVALIDAVGETLATGFPHRAGPESATVSGRPIVAPLLWAEQALIHHVVAVIGDGRLALRTTPRHGPSSEVKLDVTDEADLAAVVQRTARVSQTASVVLAAPGDRLADLSAKIRSDLPVRVRMASIDVDGLTMTELDSAVDARLAEHVEAKDEELLNLWRFHHAHGEATQGVDAVAQAIDDDRVGLLLVEHAVAVAPEERRRDGVEDLIWAVLDRARPVHVVSGPGGQLADGVGVVLADRTDPDQLAALLEH